MAGEEEEALEFKQGIEKKLTYWFLALSLIPLIGMGLVETYQLRQSLWQETQGEIARDLSERELGLDNLISAYQHRAQLIISKKEFIDRLRAFNQIEDTAQKRALYETSKKILNKEIEEFLNWTGFLELHIFGQNGQPFIEDTTRSPNHAISLELEKTNNDASSAKFILGNNGRSYLQISQAIPSNTKGDSTAIGRISIITDIAETENILSASPWPIFLFNEHKETITHLPAISQKDQIPVELVVEVHSGDEIESLSKRFNEMVA